MQKIVENYFRYHNELKNTYGDELIVFLNTGRNYETYATSIHGIDLQTIAMLLNIDIISCDCKYNMSNVFKIEIIPHMSAIYFNRLIEANQTVVLLDMQNDGIWEVTRVMAPHYLLSDILDCKKNAFKVVGNAISSFFSSLFPSPRCFCYTSNKIETISRHNSDILSLPPELSPSNCSPDFLTKPRNIVIPIININDMVTDPNECNLFINELERASDTDDDCLFDDPNIDNLFNDSDLNKLLYDVNDIYKKPYHYDQYNTDYHSNVMDFYNNLSPYITPPYNYYDHVDANDCPLEHQKMTLSIQPHDYIPVDPSIDPPTELPIDMSIDIHIDLPTELLGAIPVDIILKPQSDDEVCEVYSVPLIVFEHIPEGN